MLQNAKSGCVIDFAASMLMCLLFGVVMIAVGLRPPRSLGDSSALHSMQQQQQQQQHTGPLECHISLQRCEADENADTRAHAYVGRPGCSSLVEFSPTRRL